MSGHGDLSAPAGLPVWLPSGSVGSAFPSLETAREVAEACEVQDGRARSERRRISP
jgi:hypothetical protein